MLFLTKSPFIDTIGGRAAQWNRLRQKETILLRRGGYVASSFDARPLRRENHNVFRSAIAAILPLARPTAAGPGCDSPMNRDGRHSDQSATVQNRRDPSSESLTARLRPAWNCWDLKKKRKREYQCLPLPECLPNVSVPSNHR